MSIFVRPTAGNKYAVAYEFDAPWISRGARGPGRDHLWAAEVRVRLAAWLSGYYGGSAAGLSWPSLLPGWATPPRRPASHARQLGHGVLVAARRLGHTSASVTTRHYAHAMDDRDAQVAKHLDKLGTPSHRARNGHERSGRRAHDR
jgi:integrase